MNAVAGIRSFGRASLFFAPWVFVIAFGWSLRDEISSNFAPASDWLSVDQVFVDDSLVGEEPEIRVRRTIKRPFKADWLTTIRERTPTGYLTICTAHGANDYSPRAILPMPLTLRWWMWPTKCDLPPGEYVLSTLWTIDVPGAVDKQVRVDSNVFRILTKDGLKVPVKPQG